MSITYHKIDLFKFLDTECQSNKVVLPHVVNNISAMGSGFVVPLYTRWPQVKISYHGWDQRLGQTQFIYIDNDDDDSLLVVANMCAQNGIASRSSGPRDLVNAKPIRYLALANCMMDVTILARKTGATIVAPMFGSDRSGGTWTFIEELIEEIWKDLDVTICRLN